MSACGCDFRIKPLFGHKDDQLTAVKNPDGYVSVARFQKGEFVGSDPEYVNMSFDHPFVFLIREASTGAILFAGFFTGNTSGD